MKILKPMTQTEYVYGMHSVESLLIYSPQRVLKIILYKNMKEHKFKRLLTRIKQLKIDYQVLDKIKLHQMVGHVVHQGVVAVVKKMRLEGEKALTKYLDRFSQPVLILILDQIQDPQNFGACLRTAEGAGVNAVILPKNGSCSISKIVKKVSVGAAERLPILQVTNLVRILQQLQKSGIWIIGTTDKANTTIYDLDCTENLAIVMGSEGKGLRKLTMNHCDKLTKIPMRGRLSSLNISVATGICLFEVIRQRSLRSL